MINENQNPEEAFLQRIQTYITNLEFSNSELETQLQLLKKDLATSNTISNKLQIDNISLLDHSSELESRKRLLDLFLELRNQEKEIYIKNIDLFLSRLQKMNAKEEEFSASSDKSRAEALGLRARVEELQLENIRMQENLRNREVSHERESEFLRNQIKSHYNDLSREKEKCEDLTRKIYGLNQEINNMRGTERAFADEKRQLVLRIKLLEENTKRLETLLLTRNDELESSRRNLEKLVSGYESEMKPFVGSLSDVREENESLRALLASTTAEFTANKMDNSRVNDALEMKVRELNEELRNYRGEERFLSGVSLLSPEMLKNHDLYSVIAKLQKGYLRERTRALNSEQTLRNLKLALEKKYKVLFEKNEEWKEFKRNYEEMKKNQENEKKKINDLVQERDVWRLEALDNAKKLKGFEMEKRELYKMVEKIMEKSDLGDKMKELIEKNLEMQKKFEEIYQDSYSTI